jgi:hypothetical protein
MKRISATTVVAASLMALSTAPVAAQAAPPAEPFIKAEYWKDNISFSSFQKSPRSYFRSERAFDLLVGYVSDEIGKPLTGSQFTALMRSDQVRTRTCPTSEKIMTGFLRGNDFDWEARYCRAGEAIVQYNLGGRWIDLFSLNCLNAVEDQTPVPPPPPAMTYRMEVPPPPPMPVRQRQRSTQVWQSPSITVGGMVMSFGCICCGAQTVMGTPLITIPGSTSHTTTFDDSF